MTSEKRLRRLEARKAETTCLPRWPVAPAMATTGRGVVVWGDAILYTSSIVGMEWKWK